MWSKVTRNRLIYLSFFVIFSVVAFGCSSDDSDEPIANATITGTVAGTVVVAVDENDNEVDRNTATGTPKTFTLTIPAGGNYRFYLVENDGTTNVKTYPLFQGTTNVFSINTAATIDLGFVDTSTGVAVPTNNPFSQGASDGGTQTAIPAKLALAGTWEINSLASGPGAPWWERGPITISSDGSFTASTTESDGSTGSPSGTLAISTDGIITISGASDFRGSMDSGKTVMVWTDTWTTGNPGTTEIKVITKKAGSYSLADLAGTWEINSLASGPGAPWWERGLITISSDGSFTASTTESDGSTGSPSGTLAISTDGIITISGASDFRGSMDSGKTVMVWTDTWTTGSPGTTEIKVITKKAGSYSLADLAGTWETNNLISGPGAPWWERGPITISSDGSFTASTTESDGSTGSPSGTLAISADGIITVPGNSIFRCSMNSGKTVLACTDTRTTGNPGTTEFKVWTKK